MAANVSCPANFEVGAGFSCHVKCSEGFVYTKEGTQEKCMLLSDPTKTVLLQTLPMSPDPSIARAEQTRVSTESAVILSQNSGTRSLQIDDSQTDELVRKHERIRGDHADFYAVDSALNETIRELKPKRQPTAPADDLSRERQRILQGPGIDILMIQIALFLAVLSVLSFLVLDRDTAQGLTFFLLCTGVAIGFFLRK